jgi:hypothetical protein
VVLLVALGCQAATVSKTTSAPGPTRDAAAAAQGGGDATAPTLNLPDAGPPATPPAQTCAQEVHVAEKTPVELLLLVDSSDSMAFTSGAQTKWERLRAALDSFVREPASAGLGVGVSFFPGSPPVHMCQRDADCAGIPNVAPSCTGEGVCVAPGVPLVDRRCAPGIVTPFNCSAGLTCKRRGRCSASGGLCFEGGPCPGPSAADQCVVPPGRCRAMNNYCDVGNFGKLDVEIGDLPGHADALTEALRLREPDGSTPMVRAVESVVAALASRPKPAVPRRTALILATDGYPSCEGQTIDGVVGRLQQAFGGTPSLPTYVVGVFSADEVAEAQMNFARLAAAGGTGSPIILTTGDDLTEKLLGALTSIRDKVVACDYAIPQPENEPLDLAKVNVSATARSQTLELGRVGAADQCAGRRAWYYDVPPSGSTTPTRVVLCPASCSFVQADPAAHVDLAFGCATRIVE